MILQTLLAVVLLGAPASQSEFPGLNRLAHYEMLTCRVDTPPPLGSVDVIIGPREQGGGRSGIWWQLNLQPADSDNAPPLVQIRVLTATRPLSNSDEQMRLVRYVVRFPEVNETLEFRNVHTQSPLLPPWGGFERHFFPRISRGSGRQSGFPETCDYLGHVLTLRSVKPAPVWEEWTDIRQLDLDPELLVGTGRNFKDKEGHRLPQSPPKNYTYTPFTPDDYGVMFEAGMNLFCVSPEQEKIVRVSPAFYIRGIGDGDTVLRYPADLYRSNYLGPVMFMDEPAIIIMADKHTGGRLWHASDAAAAIEKRVRALYNSDDTYGRYLLERPNSGQRINIGDMRLDQYDFPSWETVYETAFYQMAAGCNGIVHEGRYQLAEFDKAVAEITGEQRTHTADQVLRYHYAFLRGAARPFFKHWGTAIYGQCDPALAPRAVTLAYDMGARYIWYWTSDHGHHLPWIEQLELTRTLREHAKAHPRPSISAPPARLDKAILMPYGRIASLDGLQWIRAADRGAQEDADLKQRVFMKNLLKHVHEAFDRNEDFDITVDDGREITGYRRIVRVNDQPE